MRRLIYGLSPLLNAPVNLYNWSIDIIQIVRCVRKTGIDIPSAADGEDLARWKFVALRWRQA